MYLYYYAVYNAKGQIYRPRSNS